MNIFHKSFYLVMCALLAAVVQAAEENPVFKTAKYGIFIHNAWSGNPRNPLTLNADLTVPKSIDEMADQCDIKRLVQDLQAFNCEYVIFTVWHANMNPIFPSAAMDKWRGKGHASRRDVIGELIKEIKPTGIKLFLYIHPSDGHDMSQEDQELLGWNESTNIPPANGWAPGKYEKWNNFMNEVIDEMSAKYAKDVYGFWIDGGWARVDKKRLQETVWKHNPSAEFFSGAVIPGWCNQYNRMIPPAPEKGIPAATPSNADTWPCFDVNVNLLQGSNWVSRGGWAKVSPEHMLRYTVLQAGSNTRGGGTTWAAGTYTDGTWEPMVKEYFTIFGTLIKPIEESIKNTRPSSSWITPQGSRIATLSQGMVATMSADGAYEYIHVLRGPTGTEENNRQSYVSRLQLPAPVDFKKFTKAVMLRSGREAKLTQDDGGLLIDVPWQDAWDPIDTVIKLTVERGFGLLSQEKTVTMSGPETPGWALKRAVDGNKNTGWSSEEVKAGEAAWVMIDLESVVGLSRVHLYPRVIGNAVGCNFPIDLEISVSNDGQTFTRALAVTDYKVKSMRSSKTEYVWDPVLNDYRKAEAGEETEDLSLSGSGKKSSADYPQYFVMPDGTSGRYVKITGTKVSNERRMQLMEIEVYGKQ